jgi:hypothetical protein
MDKEDELKDRARKAMRNIIDNIESMSLESLTITNMLVSQRINKLIWDEIKEGKR